MGKPNYVARFACAKDAQGRCQVPPWQQYVCETVPRRRLRQVRRAASGRLLFAKRVTICLPVLGIGLADSPEAQEVCGE